MLNSIATTSSRKKRIRRSQHVAEEELMHEYEPALTLYKALELRQRAGTRSFLPRTLSYVAERKQFSGEALSSSSSFSAKLQTWKRREQILTRISSMSQQQQQADLTPDNRFLVVRLVGILPCSVVPTSKTVRSSSLSQQQKLVYVSLFANSDISAWRLVESYQTSVPVLAQESETPYVDIPLQFDFASRKLSESFSLTFHVYDLKDLIGGEKLPRTIQLVQSDGPVFDLCDPCMRKRKEYRQTYMYKFGVDPLPTPHAPHFHILEQEASTPNALLRQNLGIWNHSSAQIRQGFFQLDTLALHLQWVNRRRNSPPLMPAPSSTSKRAVARCASCSTSTPPVEVVTQPSLTQEQKFAQRMQRMRGIRPEKDLLPMTLVWHLANSSKSQKEVLREFRCPICWMFCASWDGVLLHLEASHCEKMLFTRDRNIIHVHPHTAAGLNGHSSAMLEEIVICKSSWVTPACAKMSFVHTSDAFTLIPPGPQQEDDEESSDIDDEAYQNAHDSRRIHEFVDVSREEQQMMLLWNSFIRSEFRKRSRGAGKITLTLETLKKFAKTHKKRFLEEGLTPNFVLLMINLYDFGLVSNDDVLAATSYLKGGV